jgi:hypothetical protein
MRSRRLGDHGTGATGFGPAADELRLLSHRGRPDPTLGEGVCRLVRQLGAAMGDGGGTRSRRSRPRRRSPLEAGLSLVGATGSEPATFRPPAGKQSMSMRPWASPASPSSPQMDDLDRSDDASGTKAVLRRREGRAGDTEDEPERSFSGTGSSAAACPANPANNPSPACESPDMDSDRP